MNGYVLGGQARVWVLLRRVGQPDIRIEFTIDTGFTGFVTLPRTSVDALDLPSQRVIAANLADDTSIDVSTYLATLLWDGQERDVEVLATGARPLLGTLMLDGHELCARFEDGGTVTIQSR